MKKLKSIVRRIILTILPRYPFVNAITLLLLLAERAVNEKYVASSSFNRMEIDLTTRPRPPPVAVKFQPVNALPFNRDDSCHS